VATTTQDTSKATLALNVSCHSIRVPSIHGQSHLLDSMHPCLNVDEILRLIAHELVASGGKATAVSMACCCKSFEDPALDALWATQDQPLPLLKSFPGDVWKEDEYRDECRVSVPITCVFFLPLTIRFESLSKDSRLRWNGLVSGSTLKGWECSHNSTIQTPCLWKFYRLSNFALSTNPCSRT